MDFDALKSKYDAGIVPIDDTVIKHRSPLYWSWRTAFDRDPHASPMQHPDIVLAELTNLRAQARHKPVAIIETFGRSQNAIGILIPKVIRTSQVGGVGPDRMLHGLRLAGGRILGECNSPEQERRILKQAAEYATESNADFLLIEDLDETTSLHSAVEDQSTHGCLQFVTHDYQSHHYIDLPSSEAEYLSTFSSHSRKLFRRALKKCANFRLERVTEIQQIPDFLDAAHVISKNSWQSHQFGMRIRNDEFELQQLSALAMNGLLRSYVFSIDGKPAAFAVGNQHGGCYRYEETGYTAELRQYSPGRTMLQQIIADLLNDNPARCLDFGFGDAEYKQQFANRESRSGTVWLVPPTLRARMSLTHLNVCRRLRNAFYTGIKQSGFGTKARQWLRSHGVIEAVNAHSQVTGLVASLPE